MVQFGARARRRCGDGSLLSSQHGRRNTKRVMGIQSSGALRSCPKRACRQRLTIGQVLARIKGGRFKGEGLGHELQIGQHDRDNWWNDE